MENKDKDKDLDNIIKEIKQKREYIYIYKHIYDNIGDWSELLIWDEEKGTVNLTIDKNHVKWILDNMPEEVRDVWKRYSIDYKIKLLNRDISIFKQKDVKNLKLRWERCWFFLERKIGESMKFEESTIIKFSKNNG